MVASRSRCDQNEAGEDLLTGQELPFYCLTRDGAIFRYNATAQDRNNSPKLVSFSFRALLIPEWLHFRIRDTDLGARVLRRHLEKLFNGNAPSEGKVMSLDSNQESDTWGTLQMAAQKYAPAALIAQFLPPLAFAGVEAAMFVPPEIEKLFADQVVDPLISTGKIIVNAVSAEVEKVGDLIDENLPVFFPSLKNLDVSVPALGSLGHLGNDISQSMAYAESYLNQVPGYDLLNKGSIILNEAKKDTDPSKVIGFLADQVGGGIQPDMNFRSWGQVAGVVGQTAEEILGGAFKPDMIFNGAKLFGGIPLSAILQDLGLADIPKFRQETLPKEIVYHYNFSTSKLQNVTIPPGIEFEPSIPDSGDNGSFNFDSEIRLAIPTTGGEPPSPPTHTIKGQLTNCTLTFFNLVSVQIASFTYSTATRSPSHWNLVPSRIEFKGSLEFIAALADKLGSFASDVSGMVTKLRPDGLFLNYRIGAPAITLGAFSLENLLLETDLFLGFNAPMVVTIRLASPQAPLRARFGPWAGEAYFLAILNTERGLVDLLFSVAVSYNIGFQIGPIVGRLAFGAGFFIERKIEDDGLSVFTLKGYVYFSGRAKALGWLGVGIYLELALVVMSKEGQGNVMKGVATLWVEVSMFFFSFSYSTSVEHTFINNKSSHPAALRTQGLKSLGDTEAPSDQVDFGPIPESEWNDYFAAYV